MPPQLMRIRISDPFRKEKKKDFRRKFLKKADESDDDVEGFQSIRRSSRLSKRPNHIQTEKNRGNKDKCISYKLKNKKELSHIGKIEEGKNLQEGLAVKSKRVARRKSFGPKEVIGEDREKEDQELVGSPEVQVRKKRKVDEDGNKGSTRVDKGARIGIAKSLFRGKANTPFLEESVKAGLLWC